MLLHNGINYIRVSDVLSQYTDFSKIPPEVLDRKRQIGEEVHQAISADARGEFPIYSNACAGYFKSYDIWRSCLGVRLLQDERRYYCDKHLLTGQIDALVHLPGDIAPVLVDYKTCASVSHDVWSMQAHMYGYLLSVNNIEISDRYLFLQLDPTGALPMVCEYRFNQNILNKCFDAIDKYKEANSCVLSA